MSAARDAEARWLICVELQSDNAVGYSRSGALAAQLDNCRVVLAHARQSGWRVVHVHLRRRQFGQTAVSAARPIAGFEPLPTEAVFFRDGGPNCEDDAFWKLIRAKADSEALVIGFINDRTCAGAVASLSRASVQVVLVEDALGGGYARSFMERRVETATTGEIVRDPPDRSLPPPWLQAANAP